MLDRPDAEIVYEDGKVVGVKAQGETAKCKMVVCDPSYATDKCKTTAKVGKKMHQKITEKLLQHLSWTKI